MCYVSTKGILIKWSISLPEQMKTYFDPNSIMGRVFAHCSPFHFFHHLCHAVIFMHGGLQVPNTSSSDKVDECILVVVVHSTLDLEPKSYSVWLVRKTKWLLKKWFHFLTSIGWQEMAGNSNYDLSFLKQKWGALFINPKNRITF